MTFLIASAALFVEMCLEIAVVNSKLHKVTSAIIVAAGKGTRFGPDRDKLFLEVAGDPVIVHTWRRFENCPAIHHIVLVICDGMQGTFEELASTCLFKKPHSFAVGGKERQGSVWNG